MDTKANEDRPQAARRRRYSVEYKRQMVEETLQAQGSVSLVARRHDVNANQLFKWRKHYREGLLEGGSGSGAALVPVHLADAADAPAPRTVSQTPEHNTGGTLEIRLRGGHQIVVHGGGEPEALRVALEVLGR